MPRSTIIYKLLAFTFAMITFPIGSYFLSVNMIFGGLSVPSIHLCNPPNKPNLYKHQTSSTPTSLFHSSTHTHNTYTHLPNLITHPGNSTYAGATAAIVANIVLLSYVVVAFNDDKSEREADLASGAIQPSEGRKDR